MGNSILKEIQVAAVDVKSDLGTLLRKCKVLAAYLGSGSLESWLIWESNGYPKDVEVPEYRVWSLQVKGHFAGPFGSGIRSAPVPLMCIPKDTRAHYQRYECRQSVSSIETLLKAGKSMYQVSTADLALSLGGDVYDGYSCIQAWAEFGATELVELLNAVRNRILDLALALQKQTPVADRISAEDVCTAISPSQVTQIFKTTVYGGSPTFVAAAGPTVFNVRVNDFSSLEQFLQETGVTKPDLSALREALAEDEKPNSTGKFGPKVSAWMANMVQKAAVGLWNVGIAAAGTLLSEAITRYYGL